MKNNWYLFLIIKLLKSQEFIYYYLFFRSFEKRNMRIFEMYLKSF